MPRRSKQARATHESHYRPTPIPGLSLYPSVLLLNLIVRTAENNAKTDGIISAETVDMTTALIRKAYDFPDLDVGKGTGMAISLIGQFFHPDDYAERRIADVHSRELLDALQGDLQPRPLVAPDLRASKLPDPSSLSQEQPKTLALYYKQRFLSICFVGEKAQLDRLQANLPGELLNHILGTLWEGVGISTDTFVAAHPAFVPALRIRKVSQHNALEWAKQMSQLIKEGKMGGLTVIGPPGPAYTVRPRK